MRIKRNLLFLMLSGIASLPLVSQDWPMWGGTAQRNMTSAMKNLPEFWDVKSGKNIKWKVPIGSTSYGNPVVADGKIFLGTNNGNPRNPEIKGDKGVLMCFRESDGKFLWQAVTDKLDSGFENDWPEQGVCSSPAVEGKRLYYVSNRGELICLDTEGFMDGKNDGPFQDEVHKGPDRCRHSLEARHDEGIGRIPAFHGQFLTGHLGGSGIPRDLQRPRWQVARRFLRRKLPVLSPSTKTPARSCGRTILRAKASCTASGPPRLSAMVDGVQQVFFPGGDGWMYGFNARTGEKLWKFDMNPKDAVWPKTRNYGVSTPVFSEGKVFMSVGQDPDDGNGIGHAYCYRSRHSEAISPNQAGSGSTTKSTGPFRQRRSPMDWFISPILKDFCTAWMPRPENPIGLLT